MLKYERDVIDYSLVMNTAQKQKAHLCWASVTLHVVVSLFLSLSLKFNLSVINIENEVEHS